MDKKFAIRFLGFWIINTIILTLANTIFPGAFELGNAYLNLPTAGIFSGFLITALLLIARGLARTKDLPKKGRIVMFIYYWGSASLSVWLIARVASLSGFGIARYTWAIGTGFALSLTHWLLRQAFKGVKML